MLFCENSIQQVLENCDTHPNTDRDWDMGVYRAFPKKHYVNLAPWSFQYLYLIARN
jgi:hypothetical protein